MSKIISQIKRWLKKLLGIGPNVWSSLEEKTNALKPPTENGENVWEILEEKLDERKKEKEDSNPN